MVTKFAFLVVDLVSWSCSSILSTKCFASDPPFPGSLCGVRRTRVEAPLRVPGACGRCWEVAEELKKQDRKKSDSENHEVLYIRTPGPGASIDSCLEVKG